MKEVLILILILGFPPLQRQWLVQSITVLLSLLNTSASLLIAWHWAPYSYYLVFAGLSNDRLSDTCNYFWCSRNAEEDRHTTCCWYSNWGRWESQSPHCYGYATLSDMNVCVCVCQCAYYLPLAFAPERYGSIPRPSIVAGPNIILEQYYTVTTAVINLLFDRSKPNIAAIIDICPYCQNSCQNHLTVKHWTKHYRATSAAYVLLTVVAFSKY